MDFFRHLYRDPQIQRSLDLVFSIIGIYTCYLYYGVLQNKLYVEQKDGSKFGSTSFVLLVQCAINAFVAFIYDIISSALPKAKTEPTNLHDDQDIKETKSTTTTSTNSTTKPLSFFNRLLSTNVALTGLVYIGAMYSSNESLKYVSYAYQALAKSCKPIPVLISSVLISGKRYSLIKYVCVSMMVLGVTLFQFLDDGKSKGGAHGSKGDGNEEQSIWGIIFLIISLALDGINGPLQENVKKVMTEPEQGISNNLWAMLIMFIVALFMDQILPSITYLNSHSELWTSLLLFGLCSGLGQLFIFHTIRAFDALTLSIVTTTRKFATIVVNAIVLPTHNRLNLSQWGCVALVFTAVSIDSFLGFFTKKGKVPATVNNSGSSTSAKGRGTNTKH